MNSFNIVSLIENNPIKSIKPKTNNILINKIQSEFTSLEQQVIYK